MQVKWHFFFATRRRSLDSEDTCLMWMLARILSCQISLYLSQPFVIYFLTLKLQPPANNINKVLTEHPTI